MNYRNYSQNTNFVAGSDKLELLPFYLTDLNIPGITLNTPEAYSRGIKVNLMSDSLTFNDLSMNVLVDEDFKIYHELLDLIFKYVNPETGNFSGTTFPEFDFWIEINNSKGNKLFKIEYYNCKIISLGDINLDTKDEGIHYILPLDLRFDYFKVLKIGD